MGVVLVCNHSGALKGPAIRPCWTSVAISVAMRCQFGSTWFCCSLLWMYVRLCLSECLDGGGTCVFGVGAYMPIQSRV